MTQTQLINIKITIAALERVSDRRCGRFARGGIPRSINIACIQPLAFNYCRATTMGDLRMRLTQAKKSRRAGTHPTWFLLSTDATYPRT